MLKAINRHRTRAREDESGASMVAAIFMLVVMFTFFGLAFDVMHSTYMKASLQKSVDIAAAAAAAQVDVLPNGSTQIRTVNRVDPATGKTLLSAQQMFEETYAVQRAQYKGMGCVEPADRCWYTTTFEQNKGVIRIEVFDSIRNFWWQWWSPADADTTRSDSSMQQEVILETQVVLRGVNEERYGNENEAGRLFTNPND